MANRVSFSGKQLVLSEIAAHYSDVEHSLRQMFTSADQNEERFRGYTRQEIEEELHARLIEIGNQASLSVLASIEAAFRLDYLQRAYAKIKQRDSLSRSLRDLYAIKGKQASLEDDIFEVWKRSANGRSQIIGDLRGAFKFRHWLAHGRYWTPKFGRRYDYYGVYSLAQSVFESLPLSLQENG